ncbi:MAG: RNA polymerase sigma factor [Chloroflexota bacterium]
MVPRSNNERLPELIQRIQDGDQNAFSRIIQDFQDMAVGYGYAILGDWQLAEDVAQEAFIHAFYDLPKLRNPAAFPGWFRRIVFTKINRLQRTRAVTLVPIELVLETASSVPMPATLIEQAEIRDAVMTAIAALPEHQRTVVTLFYISGYAQKEISSFLEIPVATVKTRLHAARKHLKESMTQMQKELLIEYRPSQNEALYKEIHMNLALAKVVSCRTDGCLVRLLETDELVDTHYSAKIQDKIKIRPEQVVVIHKSPTSSQTLYRLFLAQVTEIRNNQLTVEILRDEGDRGKGRYHQAKIADGLELALNVGDDVYGYNTIFDRSTNGRPDNPGQLLATVSPKVKKIYEGETF